MAKVVRLTSDVALLRDASYARIVAEFAAQQSSLDAVFDAAWYKLTHRGGRWSQERKCVMMGR